MAQIKKAHVLLTSHPGYIFKDAPAVQWGAKSAIARGPIVASLTNRGHRNAIGTHSGSYGIYRALATASGQLEMDHRPDLTNTSPVFNFAPSNAWFEEDKIVTVDPFGASVFEAFHNYFERGYDIRPTIAVTKAHIMMLEINEAIKAGRLHIDGAVIRENMDVVVTKAAVEPVWYLPGVARRVKVGEGDLRRILFEQTGGMYPELITRKDLKVFLPPIGNTSIYIFGDPAFISDPSKELTIRVHDECNGSDVFGSDICTCRPYLTHGIEEAIRSAQKGGVGVIIYYRKEGRALGEVTKFLVYNARKRQAGGDTASTYFHRTECVAGVQDMRFQEFMPDVLHWMGIQKIDRFISMSDMKHDALVQSGIKIIKRVPIPKELVPSDASVEMEAKKAAGYYTEEGAMDSKGLAGVKGRKLNE